METTTKKLLREIASQQRQINGILKKKFEHEQDEETRDLIRSISFINRLHAKTLDWESGLLPVNHTEYTDQEKKLEHSKKWMTALEAGQNLFKGRFTEVDGLCVDHAFFKAEGLYHLIYIRSEACTMWMEVPMGNFGHATSRDLLHWEVQEQVLPVIPGSWENTHVWAPHVLFHEGKYWMFYTGVNENACQAINAATSTDLKEWTRVSEKPLIKGEDWSLWDPSFFSNCRDPIVLQDGDGFYCYYTGYVKESNQYCVGISYSTDLLNWEERGYNKLAGSLETPPESPFVVKRDDLYYMFYTSYAQGTVVATSNRPDGGFVDVQGEGYQLLGGVSASEFLEDDDGRWYMTVISHEPNHFHFIELYEMIWPAEPGEAFTLKPLVERE